LGEWEINQPENTLYSKERSVRLEPLVMDVLVYLAAEPGKVVSKEDLLAAVWAGSLVEEGSLTRAVSMLRKALGDDARRPRYIRTIFKRGYQLVAVVDLECNGATGVVDANPPAVVELLQEPMETPPPGKVLPFRSRPVFRWASSVAAALATVALSLPLYQQYYIPPELSSRQLVGSGLGGTPAQDDFWSQWDKRGSVEDVSVESSPHELLLGAQLVDLRLSLVRNNIQAADEALARINGHLYELGPQAAEAASFNMNARQGLSNGQLPQNFLQQAEWMEASLRPEEYPYIVFGKWTEAGRLSSLTSSPEFFQSEENRKFLRAFLHQEVRNLDPEVATDLMEIQETLASADPSSLPYRELQQQFEKILAFYQNRSEEGLTL
jgi:DNA-binding winged helix-turn-helix (wHTH) protein